MAVTSANTRCVARFVVDPLDDDGIDGVHQPVVDPDGGVAQHGEDGDRDGEPDDRVGALEAGPDADGAECDAKRGESVGTGVVAVGDQGG